MTLQTLPTLSPGVRHGTGVHVLWVLCRIRLGFGIQTLEPDYLYQTDTRKTETGYITQGVEFDLVGCRTCHEPGGPSL